MTKKPKALVEAEQALEAKLGEIAAVKQTLSRLEEERSSLWDGEAARSQRARRR